MYKHTDKHVLRRQLNAMNINSNHWQKSTINGYIKTSHNLPTDSQTFVHSNTIKNCTDLSNINNINMNTLNK